MVECERERQRGRCDIPLARQVDQRGGTTFAGDGGSAFIAIGPSRSARQVLARECSAGEHVRGDQSDVGVGQNRLHGRIADPVGADKAVRQLRGRRQRGTERSGGGDCFGQRLSGPVADTPRPRSARGDKARHLGDEVCNRQAVGRLHRVDQVDVVEAHPAQRSLELFSGALLRPELPPQLVGDHHAVAFPARVAKQLAEHDFAPSRRDRCVAGLVVVPGVVEERDAGVSRGAHHRQPLLSWYPFERPP